ncbi:MAG: hypothetical protein Q9209_003265 [Squamulea sp. 1 TL-2023]
MTPTHRHEPSSSFDSADAGSPRHGTPDTKSTALSPEDIRQDITAHGSTVITQPPAFLLGAVPLKGHKSTATAYHDPFLTSKPGNTIGYPTDSSRHKLSPIAPAFTPLALGGGTGENIVTSTLMVPMHPSRGGPYYSPSSLQSSPRLPEAPYSQTSHRPYSPGVQPPSTMSGQRFSTDSFLSRSVVISHIDGRMSAEDFEGLISHTKYRSRRHLVLENLAVTGTVYASFTDVRDAIEAVRGLRGIGWNWLIQFLSVPEPPMDSHQGDLKGMMTSKYEGQLLVTAEFSGPAAFFNVDTVGRLILDLLNNYGSVMAHKVVSTIHPVVAYRAEFFDVKDADHAIVHLNGFRIAGCTMSVKSYQDEGPVIVSQEDTFLDDRFSQLGLDSDPARSTMPVSRSPLFSPFPLPSPSYNGTLTPGLFNSPNSPMFFGGLSPDLLGQRVGDGSPISRNIPSYPASGMQTPTWSSFDATSSNPGAIGQERHTPMSSFHSLNQYPRSLVRHGGRQVTDPSSGHHNVVDVNRIRKGADVRTTIMLRNIPNKIDQAMLKDIVDETSWGSVGYAFINFEDPYYIIEFVNARSGHRWNRFNSDKVAEISYASEAYHTMRPTGAHCSLAIQGKDCLIFRTGNDPMAGSEEPFPGPDNPSKMRRSVENAEHVGETPAPLQPELS